MIKRFLPKKERLPKNFRAHPKGTAILGEADVRIYRSKLWAKILVFPNPESMRRFWKDALGRDMGNTGVGLCSELGYTVEHFPKKGQRQKPTERRVDPRYYAVIGLSLGHIYVDTVAHECTHAAFAYARRVGNTSSYRKEARDNNDEFICYPVGDLTHAVHEFLVKNNFYPK